LKINWLNIENREFDGKKWEGGKGKISKMSKKLIWTNEIIEELIELLFCSFQNNFGTRSGLCQRKFEKKKLGQFFYHLCQRIGWKSCKHEKMAPTLTNYENIAVTLCLMSIAILNGTIVSWKKIIWRPHLLTNDQIIYKLQKGALDSQPQVIKLTSCLPMVGGSKNNKKSLLSSFVEKWFFYYFIFGV
jgi:hypothetical protein